MNCREFEDRIDMLATGTGAGAETQALSRHAAVCGRCRRLLMAVRGLTEPLAPSLQNQLIRAVMDRTTGPACAGAQELLCDWLDHRADADSNELIALHLRHCPACSNLAATLIELGEVLPEWASIEPGPDFTAGVLRATVCVHPRRHSRRSAAPALAACWNRIILRPRFVWEAAYVGTLAVFLLLGNPAIRTSTFALPQVVARNGDQVLQWTGAALSGRQMAAHQSLSRLEERGKSLFGTVADLPRRTTASLRQKASTLIEEWKMALQDEAPRDLR